jgi:tetratricopeptide (TPR) repeat protein
LAQANADAYLPDVATTLNNLANIYRPMRRVKEAEQSFEDAIAILRDLASTNPKLYVPQLAGTLHNQAMLYYETERRYSAQDGCRQAIAILEPLWKENRQLHGNGLARAKILAAMLAGHGQPDHGCTFAREALAAAYDAALKKNAQKLIDQFCHAPAQSPV